MERLTAGRHEEAVALLSKAAADPKPESDVAEVLFAAAKFFFTREEHEKSLALLDQITDRFPDSPISSLAWCGKGQVYEKLKDTEKMIEALEKGMAGPRRFTEMNIMDASDTHSYACQALGEHYVKTAQWEKALKIYTDWQPRSWCGTCAEAMRETQKNTILLCRVHLAHFAPLVEEAWQNVANGGQTHDQLQMFLLVRTYAEAGQLDDLRSIVKRLDDSVSLKHRVERSETNKARLNVNLKATSALSTAIESAGQKDLSAYIQTLSVEGTPPIMKHVARWSLLRNARQSVPLLKAAALKAPSQRGEFLTLLAAIDSIGSHAALIDLASTRNPYYMQAACGAIYHLENRNELLAKVIARVPKENAHLIHLDLERQPFSHEFRYYQSWTRPKSKSLPRSFPEGLFEDK